MAAPAENGSVGVGNSPRHRKSISASRSAGLTGERTVKRLRLSKALTVPETTTVIEACRRMAARRVDALLLTDAKALLCGILTDKDIATRAIAREINLEETHVSKIMTRNPVFVLSGTLAVEALQKMVQGKFRHLPVVENGEVIALLDIAKCLYDAIARMERAAEKGKAIAAAVEGVEKHWGTSVSGPNTFIETLRERMFTPSLSTIIAENSNSKDMLMRVIAQDLPPESTLVEKVMTPNPECATVDTPIVDALHTMHDGKFLHLPVVDKDGTVVAVVDVLHITQAAVATVGSTAGVNGEAANSMMQKFWDSAMELAPDDEDSRRFENSLKLNSDAGEIGTQNLADVITAILQRVGDEIDRNNLPQLLYEDEDGDKVVLASDGDLQAAVDHARLAGWKGLKLHLDYSGTPRRLRGSTSSSSVDYAQADSAWLRHIAVLQLGLH
ncbi:CBS domain-containing protein CBSCBSPB4 [Sesamum angolense]|uniref:CBS domain-containing protein CBSCBSPB4 n=1 Tax=Sesamum angolense TaxID=2727404 RepID=A0AAE2BRZ6_9LAMI|nr:CBS domain-containing protein CBSCBSPB4 [Sesamum angolense]